MTNRLRIYSKRKLILILLLGLIPLILVEIWATNRLATYGQQISQLERTKKSLTEENEILSNKIAEKSSLNKSELHALNLGFQKVKNIETVTLPSLALNN